MDDEIQLISDGDGLAVIGEPAAVERFLSSEGLPSRDLGLPRLGNLLGTGAGVAQVGAEIAANSGRWVKLTKDSAARVRKYGLRENKTTGVRTGALKGPKGQVKGFVEFTRSPGTILTNPALLTGAAGMMAQLAMQQTMDEITDYLARIDEKVDDVLRAQKDAVLARMIAVGMSIDEAIITREHVGRVNEVTWSKVQTAPTAILETQAYALLQLDRLAEKLERETKVGDLAAAAKHAESTAQDWLAVLARCFQLQDAIAVLELDRVLESAPEDQDGHRLGMQAARRNRRDRISQTTERLLNRLDEAVGTANAKVLLHPTAPKALVQSAHHIGLSLADFHRQLGIDRDEHALEARRWVDAAVLVRDRALETGADGVGEARRLGTDTLDRAKAAPRKLSSGIVERARRRRGGKEERLAIPPE